MVDYLMYLEQGAADATEQRLGAAEIKRLRIADAVWRQRVLELRFNVAYYTEAAKAEGGG